MRSGSLLNKSEVFLTLLLILFGFNISFSQGDCLQKGTNGIEMDVRYDTNSDYARLTGKIGYSLSGILDAGFLGGSYTTADINSNNRFFGGAFLKYHLIKQINAHFPISASIGIEFKREKYMGDYLDERGWEKNGDYFQFGLVTYGKIKTSQVFALQPNFAISYTYGSVGIRDSMGNTERRSDNEKAFGFGISGLIGIDTGVIIRIDPQIHYSEDVTTFTISVGLIAPVAKKK